MTNTVIAIQYDMRKESGKGEDMGKAAGRNKIQRVLNLYNRLMEGDTLDKGEEALRFHVTMRSIQRDVDDVRAYLSDAAADGNVRNDVIYDRREKGYRLERIERIKLSNSEVLAICKILLDSRAFTKREMLAALRKLIGCSVPKKHQKLITDLIKNEAFHYVEPRHRTVFIDKLWSIAQPIREKHYIEIEYRRLKGRSLVRRKLRPAAVMFSEYYFYVAAFIDDKETRRTFDVPGDAFPTIYRADRIASLKVLDETFSAPYEDRFEEGEFRKRIQFMFGGAPQKVTFIYKGLNVEAVLDRLPTARILAEENGAYTISAEVFGKGIDYWLRSQGEEVEIIKETTRNG